MAKLYVDYDAFQKWQCNFDHEYQTMSWLDCSTEKEHSKKVVDKLKYEVCSEFVDRIRIRKNFSDKWIIGADSAWVSSVRDHTQNNQHLHAMLLLKKRSAEATGLDPLSSPPIAKAFNNLANEEREKLRVKFNIAHFVARTYHSPSIPISVHWKLTME